MISSRFTGDEMKLDDGSNDLNVGEMFLEIVARCPISVRKKKLGLSDGQAVAAFTS